MHQAHRGRGGRGCLREQNKCSRSENLLQATNSRKLLGQNKPQTPSSQIPVPFGCTRAHCRKRLSQQLRPNRRSSHMPGSALHRAGRCQPPAPRAAPAHRPSSPRPPRPCPARSQRRRSRDAPAALGLASPSGPAASALPPGPRPAGERQPRGRL